MLSKQRTKLANPLGDIQKKLPTRIRVVGDGLQPPFDLLLVLHHQRTRLLDAGVHQRDKGLGGGPAFRHRTRLLQQAALSVVQRF